MTILTLRNPKEWKRLYTLWIYEVWYRDGEGQRYTYTVPADNGVIGRHPIYKDLNEMLSTLTVYCEMEYV